MKAGATPSAHHVAPEHEFEAAPGLPQPLPRGETILWQGSPDPRVMAREAMHTRQLSIYFTVLLGWRGATLLADGGSLPDAAIAIAWLLPLAVLAIAALTLMGWLVSRTTVYTITDRRVVMRIGVVLNITFNLPYAKIASAGLRVNADGSGDVPLALGDTDNIAYAHLWPHARPWQVKRTQPMLRALRDARHAASVLATALAEAELDAPAFPRPQRVRATALPSSPPDRHAEDRPHIRPIAA